MKRAMNNKEVKDFLELLNTSFGLGYSKKDHFDKDENIVLVNNEPLFFYYETKVLPTLRYLLKEDILKKIAVDMGAVKFVISGADVMRPGIVTIDEGIAKDDFVAIVDQAHGKPLAVGQALFSGEELLKMSTGKAVKNLHWVGDKTWSYH